MQPLLEPPRDSLTAAQVSALLLCQNPFVDFGVERLDPVTLQVVETWTVLDDWATDFTGTAVLTDGAMVHRKCADPVQGTLDLKLCTDQTLPWGSVLVRPYQLLSDADQPNGPTARFNLGVYELVTPDSSTGQTPPVYSVTGNDLMYWLTCRITDSVSVRQGDNVFTAVESLLTKAGWVSPVLLDGTAINATFAADRVWVMADGQQSWLTVLTDMLAAINYTPPWADWNGAFRSGPDVTPANRPSEFTVPVNDQFKSPIDPVVTTTQDLYSIPNRWIFQQNGVDNPLPGAGLYVVDNLTNGPSSQQARNGRVRLADTQSLDAVDQPSLIAQGNKIALQAQQPAKTLKARINHPFPALWQADRLTWSTVDSGGMAASTGVLGQEWDMPLGIGQIDYTMTAVS